MNKKYRIVTDSNKGYAVEKWSLFWPFWKVMGEPDTKYGITPFSFSRIDAANNFIKDQKLKNNFKKEIVKFKTDQELLEKKQQENKTKANKLEESIRFGELLNRNTSKIQFTYLPCFWWNTTSNKVVDTFFQDFQSQEYYKICNVTTFLIS